MGGGKYKIRGGNEERGEERTDEERNKGEESSGEGEKRKMTRPKTAGNEKEGRSGDEERKEE